MRLYVELYTCDKRFMVDTVDGGEVTANEAILARRMLRRSNLSVFGADTVAGILTVKVKNLSDDQEGQRETITDAITRGRTEALALVGSK